MATKKKMLQAAAGNAGGAGLNVEDVFSTYLYDGTGANQTITNGIDLAGEGGLVWIKSRSNGFSNYIYDTERGTSGGAGYFLATNSTVASTLGSVGKDLYQFNSDGFELGPNFNAGINNSGHEQVSWTFRKAPKFFDVVTYSGNGTAGHTISHNLGVAPGCIIIKSTSSAENWQVWHRSVTGNLELDNTGAVNASSIRLQNVTSTSFDLKTFNTSNASGQTYVAYVFAHNDGDGGFGPDGDADIIKCGSYTGNGSTTGPVIDLGFEPQWLLIKNTTSGGTGKDWVVIDSMRGFNLPSINTALLTPNSSSAETASGVGGAGDSYVAPSGEGFQPINDRAQVNTSGDNYIYVAIRRGPMAVPESGSDVFFIDTYDSSATPPFTTTATIDFALRRRVHRSDGWYTGARMVDTRSFRTENANEEDNSSLHRWDYNNGWGEGSFPSSTYSWMWKRAPSYFDVVGYTGNGTAGRTVSHNLGVAPEMIWVKGRDASSAWFVYHSGLNVDDDNLPETDFLILNSEQAAFDSVNPWNDTAPTNSVFTLSSHVWANGSNKTHIAYLFASLDGISKVGSYTGNGTSQTINCGFTSGARFILIKRTDSAGDWYVWDTERGIVTGNDPHLSLNTTSAEVTSDDSIDPASSGFIVNQVSATNINVSSANYIFYAIA